MDRIYHAPDFALTQAALDQIGVIRADHLGYFPEDPPVVAGISVAYPLRDRRLGEGRVVVGFWQQSNFPPEAWETESITRVGWLSVIFNVADNERAMFRNAAIDYRPEKGFYLRPMDQGAFA